MKLKSSQICHINKNIIIDLNSKMAALLNIDGQIRLLLGQFLNQSSSVSQSFSNLHSNLSFGLLCVVKLPTV